jgi:formylmethanofuran dehydrogenase subunit E
MIMHEKGGCKYTGINREQSIEDLAAFHGHLGPYIVLGYRIGRYARQHFCSDPFNMSACVHCNAVPPQSCLADGVQIGSGCTLGKRNIEIVPGDEIFCEFSSDGMSIVIRPRPIRFPENSGDNYPQLIEKLAEDMYGMPDRELFYTGSDR